jgi:DNA-binding winged helix-turn-helix (wHTH) protein
MALDTSEHADHLISIYKNRGYRFVEHVRWESVNYRSVVLSKVLARAPF